MTQQFHNYISILKFAWDQGRKNIKLRRVCFYTSLFISLTVTTYYVTKSGIELLDYNLTGRFFDFFSQIPFNSIYTYLEQASFPLWVFFAFIIGTVTAGLFLAHFFIKGWIGSLIIAASEEIYQGNEISISNLKPSALRHWGAMVIMDWMYLAVYFFLFSAEAISYLLIISYLPGFFSYISLVFFGIIFFCAVILVSLTQVFARRYKIFYNLPLFQSLLKSIQFIDKHLGAALLFGVLNAIVYWVGMLFYGVIALILPLCALYIFKTTTFSYIAQADMVYGLIIIFALLSLYTSVNAGSAFLRNVYEIAATKFFHEIERENHPVSG